MREYFLIQGELNIGHSKHELSIHSWRWHHRARWASPNSYQLKRRVSPPLKKETTPLLPLSQRGPGGFSSDRIRFPDGCMCSEVTSVKVAAKATVVTGITFLLPTTPPNPPLLKGGTGLSPQLSALKLIREGRGTPRPYNWYYLSQDRILGYIGLSHLSVRNHNSLFLPLRTLMLWARGLTYHAHLPLLP